MNRDEAQARWILARGWLDPALVSQVYQVPGPPNEDFCARLFVRGLISAEQAAAARAAVSGARRDSSRRYVRPGSDITESQRRPTHPLEARPGSISSSIRPVSEPPRRESSEISESIRATLNTASTQVRAPERGHFGPYELLGEISRGGMGVVMRAQDPKTNRTLALKLLVNQGGNDHAFERFKREARVLARLRHPNIITVENFGRERGIPYYAMHYIEGETLSETVRKARAKGRSLPEQTLIRWFLELADALRYCREMGVIHRDLKPSNIIIERESKRLVLIDFGLVKKDRSASVTTADGLSLELSKSGEVRGTPAFMAPEQIDAKSEFGDISEATDIWGFGATLFFCLTGVPPYDAETQTNIYVAILTRDPPRARARDRGVSKFFDKLCHDCLQRRSEKRPRADELLERLESARRDVSVPERRATGRGRRKGQRRKVAPALFLAIGFVAAAIVAASWVVIARIADERSERVAELRQDFQARCASLDALARSGLDRALSAEGASSAGPLERGLEAVKALRALVTERRELGDEEAGGAAARLDALSGRLAALLILASAEDLSRIDARRLSALSAAIPAGAEEDFTVRWARARLALARGENRAAVAGLEALVRDRSEVALYEDLAESHRRGGRAREAIRVLEEGAGRLTAVRDRARLILAGAVGVRDPGAVRRRLAELPRGDLGASVRLRASEAAWQVNAFDLFPRWMAAAQPEELRAHDSQRVAHALTLLDLDRPGQAAGALGAVDSLDLSAKQRAVAIWIQGRAAFVRFDFPVARRQLQVAAERAGAAGLPALRLRALRRVIQICGVDLDIKQASKLLGEAKGLVSKTSSPEERLVFAQMLVDPANNAAVLMPLITAAPEIAMKSPIAGSRDLVRAPPSLRFNTVVQSALESRVFGDTPAADRLEAGMRLWFTPQPERADRLIERLGKEEAPDLLLRAARSWGVSQSIPGAIEKPGALALFQKARRAARSPLVMRAQRFASGYIKIASGSRGNKLPEQTRRAVFRSLVIALNERPFDPITHKLMALFAAADGGPIEGQARALGAAYLDPTDPELLALIGRTEREPRRALSFLRFASLCDSPGQRDDRDRLVLLHELMRIAAAANERALVADAARRALSIDPRDPPALEAVIALAGPAADQARRELGEARDRGLRGLEKAEQALKESRYSEARDAFDACRGAVPLLAKGRWFGGRAKALIRDEAASASRSELSEALSFLARAADGSIAAGEEFFAAALGTGPAAGALAELSAKTRPVGEVDVAALLLRAAAFSRGDPSGAGRREELAALDAKLKRAIAVRDGRADLRIALAIGCLMGGAARDARDELGCLVAACRRSDAEGGGLVFALQALAFLRSGERELAADALREARERGFDCGAWSALFQAEDFLALDRQVG